LVCERAADAFAGIDHAVRLGIAGGVASIVTEADTFEELRELPRFGLGQNDCDLYGFHDSVRLDVAAAGIDLSFDAPGEAAVLEQAREFQGTVELI
jgi:hypothetical protein